MNNINVTKCIHFDKSDIPNGCTAYWDGECNRHDCYFKQLETEKIKNSFLKNIIKNIYEYRLYELEAEGYTNQRTDYILVKCRESFDI